MSYTSKASAVNGAKHSAPTAGPIECKLAGWIVERTDKGHVIFSESDSAGNKVKRAGITLANMAYIAKLYNLKELAEFCASLEPKQSAPTTKAPTANQALAMQASATMQALQAQLAQQGELLAALAAKVIGKQ